MNINDDININYPISDGLQDVANRSIETLNDYVDNRGQRYISPEKSDNDGLVRPYATFHEDYGDDGRAGMSIRIEYRCPNCMEPIRENEVGCLNCRIFFDWSKKATVVTRRELVWK